jgi:endonuclease YncB( thermonuclease family)
MPLCSYQGDRLFVIVLACDADFLLKLDRWMVANGWTIAYRRYSEDYVADEDVVRQGRANILSGDFDMPWDWRAQAPKPITERSK